MAAKNNIRSIRFSDELAELINRQVGKTFTEKFENLVTHCVWELPEKEARLKEIEKQIQNERKRLGELVQKRMELQRTMAGLDRGRPPRKRNLFPCFLQLFRTTPAHINVLADEETIVAHQALTYRAQIETMDGFLHRPGESPLFFPLIQQIEDDLLGFGLGSLPRLGKRHRRALPQFSAFRTNQVIHKFVGIGAIDQMLLNNPFHRPHPFLIPKFFDFTVAVLCT